MLFRGKRRPSPCPSCDAEIESAAANDDVCPECDQVLLRVRVAGFWRRCAGLAVDLAILAVTAGPLFYLLTKIAPSTELAAGSSGIDALLQSLTADVGAILARVTPLLLMAILYFGLFLAISARTPGQGLVRVRVVDLRGQRPSPQRSALRLAANVLGLVPGALGALWMAFDMEKRAFHDHVAGTYVVRDT